MKNIRVFLSEKFQFLEVKFSIHLNRHVFVMLEGTCCAGKQTRNHISCLSFKKMMEKLPSVSIP